MDYSIIFTRIYAPVGSIWQAPNRIWNNGFARNKSKIGIHPAVVEKIRQDSFSVQLAPGTRKDYNIGSCVFTTSLKNCEKKTYFLLKLSMPISINELLKLERGWKTQYYLSNSETKELIWQIKMCKG